MQRKRHGRLWLLAMAVIAAVSCLAVYRLREPQLLAKATLIAHTGEWELPNGTDAQSYMTYYWPSNREMLFFKNDDQVGELLCRHDMATGVQTPFRTVSRWWSDDGWFKKEIEISPDGQWILWDGDYGHDADGGGNYHGYYGARRDGTDRFHIAGKGWPLVYSFHWLSDSRHFIETTARYIEKTEEYKTLRVVMRSVDAPGQTSEPPYDVASISGVPAYPPTPGGRMIVEEPAPPHTHERYRLSRPLCAHVGDRVRAQRSGIRLRTRVDL